MSDWVILRTKGRHTLPLAQSLQHGGYEAWTPVEQVFVSSARPKVEAPVWPTFVFARRVHLMDLIELSNSPSKRHSDFSVFRFNGSYRSIGDTELSYIRRHLSKKVKPRARQTMSKGTLVTVEDGAWAGLPGVVERDNGKVALVAFDWLDVELPSILLRPFEKRAA